MYTSGVGLTTTIELYARFVATNTTNPCFTDPTPTPPGTRSRCLRLILSLGRLVY